MHAPHASHTSPDDASHMDDAPHADDAPHTSPDALAQAPPVVRIQSLQLLRFRAHDNLSFQPHPSFNALAGPNGAGKTSILDALAQLSPHAAVHHVASREFSRHTHNNAHAAHNGPGAYGARNGPGAHGAHNGWSVRADVATPLGTRRLSASLPPAQQNESVKRSLNLDDAKASPADVADVLQILHLSPADAQTLHGEPELRRRFLDRLIANHDPKHPSRLQQMRRAARQRSVILQQRPSNPQWLDSVETSLAQLAVAVASARLIVVQNLLPHLNRSPGAQHFLASPHIQLDGPLAPEIQQHGALLAETSLMERLARSRSPHDRVSINDDLLVSLAHNQRPARSCSSGERQAMLASLFLASARLLSSRNQRPPVLLLDEPASHLDPPRARSLILLLQSLNAQIFLAAVEPQRVAPHVRPFLIKHNNALSS